MALRTSSSEEEEQKGYENRIIPNENTAGESPEVPLGEGASDTTAGRGGDMPVVTTRRFGGASNSTGGRSSSTSNSTPTRRGGGASTGTKAGASSSYDIRSAEQKGGVGNRGAVPNLEIPLGKGYTGKTIVPGAGKVLGFAGRLFNSKKARNGGIIGGGVVGVAIMVIIAFSPILRLEHLLQSINNRAFAAANNTLEHRMEYLFDRYILLKIANLRSCKAVVSNDCRANYANTGLAGNMFNAWRDARVEEKILRQMDLEVISTKNPDQKAGVHSFTLREISTGKTKTFDTEGDWVGLKDGQFEGGRREFGRNMRKAIKAETLAVNVMQRKSVRTYLVRKHIAKVWCFIACKKKDKAEEKIKDSKTKYKYRFIKKFVYPFSAKYAVIMTCITTGDVAGGRCSEKLKQQGLDRSDLPQAELDDLIEDLKDAEKRGQLRFSSVVLERMLTKILLGNKAAARATLSAVPAAGQIYMGLTIAYFIDQADQAVANNELSKMTADINSSQYIEFYLSMRSDNDCMKKGVCSLDDVRANAQEFDGAEESLVWQAYNNKSSSNVAAIISPAVFAQGSQNRQAEKEPRLCANGKPIPKGNLVCEEKKISRQFKIEEIRSNSFVDGAIDLVNPMNNCLSNYAPGPVPCAITVRSAVKNILGAVDFAVGTVFGPAVEIAKKAFENAPGSKQLVELTKKLFKNLMMAVFQKQFPLPLNADSPGPDKYDAMEAGGQLAGSEFNQGGYTDDGDSYGLGAPKISKKDLAAVYEDNLAQQQFEQSTSSFYDRIASVDNPDSLISRVAFVIPTSFSKISQSLISAPLNAFGNLFNSFNLIFSPANAQSLAQQQVAHNPFGITPYAYPLNHSAITADPSNYTEEKCAQLREARIKSKKENKITGFDEYPEDDPCLLEERTVEAGCSKYDDGTYCDPDNAWEGEGEDTATAPVSGDIAGLAQQLLDLAKQGKIVFGHNDFGNDSADRSNPDENIEDLAAGKEAHTTQKRRCTGNQKNAQKPTTPVKVELLKFLVDLAKSGNKVRVNAIVGQCHSGTSAHYSGIAVDFGCPLNVSKADEIGKKYGISHNFEHCGDPYYHYHYSVGGR